MKVLLLIYIISSLDGHVPIKHEMKSMEECLNVISQSKIEYPRKSDENEEMVVLTCAYGTKKGVNRK